MLFYFKFLFHTKGKPVLHNMLVIFQLILSVFAHAKMDRLIPEE